MTAVLSVSVHLGMSAREEQYLQCLHSLFPYVKYD